MRWLHELYPSVRSVLLAQLPSYWPELRQCMEEVFAAPPPPELMVVLASSRAAAGDPARAVHAGAAIVAVTFAARNLDAVARHDRDAMWQRAGEAWAANYASALVSLAFRLLSSSPHTDAIRVAMARTLENALFEIGAGQQRHLDDARGSMPDYWRILELITGARYGAAAAIGALAGEAVTQDIEACRAFGFHCGLAIRLRAELETTGPWSTLSLLHALETDHPARSELVEIVRAGRIDAATTRVGEILEQAGSVSFVRWAMTEQRRLALVALATLPDAVGRTALKELLAGFVPDP